MIWWVLYTKRSLSLSELCDAMAFRERYLTYQQYKDSGTFVRPAEMKKLLATSTRGLVEAAEIGKTQYTHFQAQTSYRVQFIHESVQEYLLHQRITTIQNSTSM